MKIALIASALALTSSISAAPLEKRGTPGPGSTHSSWTTTWYNGGLDLVYPVNAKGKGFYHSYIQTDGTIGARQATFGNGYVANFPSIIASSYGNLEGAVSVGSKLLQFYRAGSTGSYGFSPINVNGNQVSGVGTSTALIQSTLGDGADKNFELLAADGSSGVRPFYRNNADGSQAWNCGVGDCSAIFTATGSVTDVALFESFFNNGGGLEVYMRNANGLIYHGYRNGLQWDSSLMEQVTVAGKAVTSTGGISALQETSGSSPAFTLLVPQSNTVAVYQRDNSNGANGYPYSKVATLPAVPNGGKIVSTSMSFGGKGGVSTLTAIVVSQVANTTTTSSAAPLATAAVNNGTAASPAAQVYSGGLIYSEFTRVNGKWSYVAKVDQQ